MQGLRSVPRSRVAQRSTCLRRLQPIAGYLTAARARECINSMPPSCRCNKRPTHGEAHVLADEKRAKGGGTPTTGPYRRSGPTWGSAGRSLGRRDLWTRQSYTRERERKKKVGKRGRKSRGSGGREPRCNVRGCATVRIRMPGMTMGKVRKVGIRIPRHIRPLPILPLVPPTILSRNVATTEREEGKKRQ